jgi:hypothetical protein
MCVATQRPEGLRHVEAFGLALADRRDEALDRVAVQRNLSLDLRPVRFAGGVAQIAAADTIPGNASAPRDG